MRAGPSRMIGFPEHFLWGTATSAYQVEGSPLADGAGPSIWHRFAHTPGLVRNGSTGDIACDHYRRYREDVALMRRLGTNAYRFSIAWSRVMPRGRNPVNAPGLDFYERLVDALLDSGIEPMVTLYHWDLPAALDDRGGWLNPDIANWFAEYAAAVFRRLDGRVKMWTTLNEPWVVTDGGYLHGTLAPGHRNRFEAPIASHHLLRAHAEGVKAYRAEGRHRVGIVVNLEPKYPASDDLADRAATMRADAYMNRQYLDPIFLGRYPDELRQMFDEAWPHWPAEDFTGIQQPIRELHDIGFPLSLDAQLTTATGPPSRWSVSADAAQPSSRGRGVHPQNLMLFRVQPNLNRYDDTRTHALYAQLLERIAAVPGVRAAALTNPALLSGGVNSTSIFVRGRVYD